MHRRKTRACDRAMEYLSANLDGEITELERASLDRHLNRCSHCRLAAFEIHAFTEVIRTSPVVTESRTPVPTHSSRRQRLGVRPVSAGITLVAAAIAAVGLLPLLGAGPRGGSALLTAVEQQRFAREHVLREPTVFALADIGTPLSFASRALR